MGGQSKREIFPPSSAKLYMNTILETAINRIASLPDAEQQCFAEWLVAELDDEARWQAKFAASIPLLEQMGDEALGCLLYTSPSPRDRG